MKSWLKAPANEETLLRKHVSLIVSLFAREQNISWGNSFCFWKTKTFSIFSETFCFCNKCFPFSRRGNNVDWILWLRRLCVLNWACEIGCFQRKGCWFTWQGNSASRTFARPGNILAPAGKPISANRGLNLANRGWKFILRLDSVPESTINTNQVINEGLNLIHLASPINSLIGGKNLIKTNEMADLNFAILLV